MKKIKEIWKDPVWSKVISAGIILLIATIWAKFLKISLNEIYEGSIIFLNFKLNIYYFLIILLIILVIRYALKKWRKKNPYLDEKVGNYTFGELCDILMEKKPTGRTTSMNWGNESPPDLDYLSLFYNYYSYFNRGIKLEDDYDDRGFIYGILCPDFVGYDLLEKIESKNERLNMTEISYQISDNGRKFHSILERSNMFKRQPDSDS